MLGLRRADKSQALYTGILRIGHYLSQNLIARFLISANMQLWLRLGFSDLL